MVEHIVLPEGTSFRAQVCRPPQAGVDWHFHTGYELTAITLGVGRWHVGDAVEPCRAGDMVLLGPNVPHSVQSCDPRAEAVMVHFRRDFLGRDLWQAPEFAGVADLLGRAGRGLGFSHGPVERMRSLARTPDPTQRVLALLNLLHALTRIPGRLLAGESFRAELNTEARHRIERVCQFLAERYAEPITLTEVARVANLTPAAFCRFFRRATHHTLTSYLRQLRISAARRLLIETDRPVAQIATGCGFSNLSHFNRVFRALTGHTPRGFRTLSRTGIPMVQSSPRVVTHTPTAPGPRPASPTLLKNLVEPAQPGTTG